MFTAATASVSRPLAIAKGAFAPALFAVALGLGLLYGTGFAGADVLHNAAHDGRHSFAFPCH